MCIFSPRGKNPSCLPPPGKVNRPLRHAKACHLPRKWEAYRITSSYRTIRARN